MAGGKNKEFMEDPVAFQRIYSITKQGAENLNADANNVAFIDLRGDRFRGAGLSRVFMEYYGTRHQITNRQRLENTRPRRYLGAWPVKAYFLTAGAGAEISFPISNHADYLFTYELSGCLFAAYGADRNNLTVEHSNYLNVAARAAREQRYRNRVNTIAGDGHAFCRILTPHAPAALPPPGPGVDRQMIAYPGGAELIGVLEGDGWHFYYILVPHAGPPLRRARSRDTRRAGPPPSNEL
jgi:hypothetical protein